MQAALNRLITWVFIKKTGMTAEDLAYQYAFNYWQTRSSIRSYYRMLKSKTEMSGNGRQTTGTA